jgi:hypothetical protein
MNLPRRPRRPGHVRLVAKRTGRGAGELPAEVRTACGGRPTDRDILAPELRRALKAGAPLCNHCLAVLSAFRSSK